jgi:hypothetical protein
VNNQPEAEPTNRRDHPTMTTEQVPAEPAVGTVLAYVRDVGDRTYTYASLRAGDGRWYTTGGASRQGVDWPTLSRALHDPSVRYVSMATAWQPMLMGRSS